MSPASTLGQPDGPAVRTTKLPLSSQGAGSWLLVVLGVLTAGTGVLVIVGDGLSFPGLCTLGIGLAMLGAGGWNLRYAVGTAEIRLFERGLRVVRRGTPIDLAFATLRDLYLVDEEVLSNGRSTGRVFKVRLHDGQHEARFNHYLAAGAPADPALRLIQVVLERLGDAVSERLTQGASLAGDGWQLGNRGLVVKDQAAVAFADLLPPARFEDGITFWTRGREEPLLRIPAKARNAHLLREVVNRHVEQTEAGVGGRGRVLFEKQGSRLLASLLGLVALGGAAGGLLSLRDETVMGLALLFGALLAGVGAAHLFLTRFRCYERAVAREGLFGRGALEFAELESFTHSAVRQYYNGAYTGTTLRVKFTGADGRKVSYDCTVRGESPDLDHVRELVSGLLADKLFERARRGTPVPWGGMQLRRDGLVYRPSRLFGKGEEVFVPWPDVRFSIDQGVFHLFVPEAPKSVVDMTCATENFWPGFLLMRRLADEVGTEAEQAM